MKLEELKKYMFNRIAVVCTVSFILIALFMVLNEIFDISFLVFKRPPAPIDWAEIGVEIFFVLIVGAFAVYWITRLDLKRKQAEEALKNSEEQYRDLFDNTNDLIQSVATDGHLLFVNRAWQKVLGYSEEEIANLTLWDIIHPDSISHCTETFQKVMSDEAVNNIETVFVGKDGSLVVIEGNAYCRFEDGKPVSIQCICRDVTERKWAEEALRKGEANFRNMIEKNADSIVIVGRDGIVHFANPAAGLLFGKKAEELLKEMFGFPVVAGETTELDIIHGGAEITTVEMRMVETEWEGEIAYLASLRDVSERKRMEETLRESERRYRVLAENARDVIWTVDINSPTHLAYISPAVTSLLGYSAEEVMMTTMEEVFTPASFEAAMKALAEELVIEKTEQMDPLRSRTLELDMNRKDGSIVPVEVKYSFLREYDGRPVKILAIARDITKRKQIQEQLMVTDRLASIGELVSGVAHELNNPLTSVIGFSQLLLDKDVPDDIKEDLKIISSEAQRTAGVVKGLLTFARKHAPVRQVVNINIIMEETLKLRAYEQRLNNIQVNTQFAPDLPEIMADYFQLQQVFINIIINAEYFMVEAHQRGNLMIVTGSADNTIRIIVTDDGPGIPKEKLGHLFDPFFTTKEVGKGTGLGLSICHGIIVEHGGRIYAESELSKGATFVVELPIDDHRLGEEE